MTYDISINNQKYISNWVFSKRSLDTSFYWSNQANHKLIIKIDNIHFYTPQNTSNCTSRSKFWIITSFLGETEDISIGGENGEIP